MNTKVKLLRAGERDPFAGKRVVKNVAQSAVEPLMPCELFPVQNAAPVNSAFASARHLPYAEGVEPLVMPVLNFKDDERAHAKKADDAASGPEPLVAPKLWG